MAADFDVRAKLTLDSRAAFGGAQRMSASLMDMSRKISNASGLSGGLVTRLVGIAGAYVGLNAGINLFKGLSTSAVGYTAELESTRIGLQSVLSAITGNDWETAGKMADDAFEKIKTASIASPASAKEMFDIFKGISGPIMGAGFEMDKVVSMTNDAVLAASALGVDYAQASRDISMMARGVAGVDVKTFSLLRSTKAIKETTEQWNKLDEKKRVEKLSAALAKFKTSGDAFGKSWVGVTSTFQGIYQEATRAFMSPIMGMAARKLGAANDYLIAHQDVVAQRMQLYGERIAINLGHAWDRGADAARWVIAHWGTITRNIDDAMLKLHTFGPQILHAAKLYAELAIGTKVAGTALGVGGQAVALGGMTAGGMKGLLGLFAGGGTAAAGAATAAAGATAVEGVAAAEVATTAAAGAATVSLGAVAAGLVVVAAMGEPVVDNWKGIKEAAVTSSMDVWRSIVDMGESMWKGLRGPLYVIGGAVAGLGHGLLTLAAGGITAAANAVRWFFDGIEPISTVIYDWAVPAMQRFTSTIKGMAEVIDEWVGRKRVFVTGEGISDKDVAYEQSESTTAAILAGVNAASVHEAVRQSKLAKQGTHITNDFRGSSIKLEQKFDGDIDPDRIVVAELSALTRQAEIRYSTGYAGAFTR